MEFLPRVIIQRGIFTRGQNSTWNSDPGSQFNVEFWPVYISSTRGIATQDGVKIQQRDQNSTAKEGHNSTKNPLNIEPGSVFNRGVKILSYTGSKIVKRLQYDPVITDKNIGITFVCLVLLQPCTDLSWSVALWLIRRRDHMTGLVQSKPPQRRQGLDPRSLWLLVRTPSALGPELAYSLGGEQPTQRDVTVYFWYTILITIIVLCIFMNSPL